MLLYNSKRGSPAAARLFQKKCVSLAYIDSAFNDKAIL
jgi:hypothetical protein